MRREGRIHGSYVRMSKHEPFEYNKGAPRKPTNHSKVSAACLGNKVRCLGCHDKPVLKAMCKTKGKYKLKDLDVTRNHKLDQFSFGCSPSRFVPSSPRLYNYDGVTGEILWYNYDSDEYSDREETLDQRDNYCSSEMAFTVASFLRDMRGANEVHVDAGTRNDIFEEETPCETLQHGIPVESDRQIETETDSDCSWSGVDMSDSEQESVDVDGWYLVG